MLVCMGLTSRGVNRISYHALMQNYREVMCKNYERYNPRKKYNIYLIFIFTFNSVYAHILRLYYKNIYWYYKK